MSGLLDSTPPQHPAEDLLQQQEYNSPRHTPGRPPHLNETVVGRRCGCGCSCVDCTCNYSRSPGGTDEIASTNFEPQSLASNFSELTFGESVASAASFDGHLIPLDPHDQFHQANQTNMTHQRDAVDEDDEIDLDDIDNDPQAYYLDRWQSRDSNQYFNQEPLIFDVELGDSMEVNTGGEEEHLRASEVSSNSLSSGGSSALVKDAGAVFGTGSGSGPNWGPWVGPNNYQGYIRLT